MRRATFAPETTGRIGSVSQKPVRADGTGGWLTEDVPFNALYDALGQLTSFQAVGTSPVFQWGHTYSEGTNGERAQLTVSPTTASACPDLATIGAEGYITVVDRKKDMIKTGGENVASREVEEMIYRLPAVSEVAVVSRGPISVACAAGGRPDRRCAAGWTARPGHRSHRTASSGR